MSLSLEHIDSCIPITGLKVFCLKDSRLILQTQGNYSCLIDEESGKLLAKLRAFKSNNIHGFLILNQTLQDEGPQYVQVVAWGEYSLRLIDLFYFYDKANGHSSATLTAASAEYLAPDWILAGCTDESGNAYLVTGNNALLGVSVVNTECSRYKSAIHLRQLVNRVKSLLYSADAITLSPSHILITAGTVFGEIIVWSCFLNGPEGHDVALGSIHHFFTGHEGSIFNISISPEIPLLLGNQSGRLLASCSDDRTIRIWDISDCERKSCGDPSTYSTDGFELRSTGFGADDSEHPEVGSESCIAKAFGHISRIWGVSFLPMLETNHRTLNLVSHGEDATCLLWELNWDQDLSQNSFQLRQVSSFHNHTGKNIFCLDMYRASREAIIHTGGADGALKTLRINEHDTANRLTDGTSTLPDSRHSPKPKSRYLFRKYSLVSSDCFLAAGVQGEIQLGRLIFEKEAKSASNFQVITETLCVDEDLRSFSAIASLPNKGLVLLGNAKGLIRLYNHNNRSLSVVTQVDQKILGLYAAGSESHSPLSNSSLLSFVTSYVQDFTASLFIISAESSSSDMHVNSITLHLPVHFEINCVSLICSNQCLVLGSRRGALAIYLVSNSGQPLQPLTVIRRVHGDHIMSGVTQITPFWQFTSDNDTITEYFLTCGRDGQYCVHEMKVSKSLENPMSHKIVHHSNPPLGTIIAGAYFDKVSEDLMLYGFHHKNFVLWNETVHTEVLTIDCGGARGNWSIHPSDGTTGGMLLWSQGPALNAYRLPTDSSRPIRAGVHGREIKSMEVLNTPDKNKTIFATGSEDTTVRIFTPIHSQSESTWGSFKCLRVLKQLASLQQVSFSKNGKFLFISGGLEEFCIWKICLIPVFGLAGCLVASSPKNDSNSDLRVTSFDILDVDEPGSEDSFLICLTLSNSTIKIFHFSSSAKDGFTLLARGTYTSNCLTQARFLRKNSTMSLITTCTDGHFALWSLTPLLKPLYTLTSPTLSTKQQFSPAIIAPENIEYDSRYQIHSNSIKSMEITHLSDTLTLIAAGGDDNAVSLSLVSTDFIASDLNASVMTVSIPDAHAASVTAVKVLSQTVTDNTTTVHIASSGNDHQVKIWSVVVDPQKDGTECMNVKNVANEYSNVADISSLDVIYGDADGASTLLDGNGNSKLLVCGVGMEMLRIKPCRL